MESSHLSNIYQSKFGLLADLYHLTMAYGFWKNGIQDRPAVFQLYFRRAPFGQTYGICAGLGLVLDYLRHFRFTVDDIQYLGSLKGEDGQALFEIGFLNYLQRLEFKCDVFAIAEGTAVHANQPLLRVEGPLLQAQIIESALLTMVNFSTLIATKASRIVQAAKGEPVLEFGLRRAQGIDGALTAARSAYIGGCSATSNLMAGRYYGIPVKGTHAHSWVMSFADEYEAYAAYAAALPNNCIFLVDTYDTEVGIRNAIQVGRELKARGYRLQGIRLDSGDLAYWSKKARQMLDEADMQDAVIVASDSLDETRIQKLEENGAKINVWGVGTELVTGGTQAAMGGVYKITAIQEKTGEWRFPIKKSEDPIKMSNPGIHQVRRFFDVKGKPLGDVLFDKNAPGPLDQRLYDAAGREAILPLGAAAYEDLLQMVVQKGKVLDAQPSLGESRQRALNQQALFHLPSEPYLTGMDRALYDLRMRFVQPETATAQ
jgi:nicotinate phosphoribosyltransferase